MSAAFINDPGSNRQGSPLGADAQQFNPYASPAPLAPGETMLLGQKERLRNSPITRITRVAIVLGLGLPAAVACGVAYAYAVCYLPFVQLVVALPLLLGMGVAALCAWLMKQQRIVNRVTAVALVLLLAVTSWYAAWAIHPIVNFGAANAPLLIDPWQLANYWDYGFQHGFWTYDNAPVKGMALLGIWLVEFGFIVGAAVLVNWFQWRLLSFCNQCDCWTGSQASRDYVLLGKNDPDTLRLAGGELPALASIAERSSGGVSTMGWTNIELFCCPHCWNANYLTATRTVMARDRYGRENKSKTPLVINLAIEEKDLVYVLGLLAPEQLIHSPQA